ncbi:hypothetical protein [Streptomyces sp. NBC_00467]|uniref:hypothetical protein n=1 Tax=Streptomyces sp. NBC_00467 TaxID=2975752 RepID=UPI002E198DB5
MNCIYCDLPDADRLAVLGSSSSGRDWTHHAHPSFGDARGVEPFGSRLPSEKGAA